MRELQLIRALTEPTIELDEISGTDVEAGTAKELGYPKSPINFSKQYGGVFPLIQVNDRVFDAEQVNFLELRSTGIMPGIIVSIRVNDKSFYSLSFPKDGDVLSIFIRSKNNLFKPIRNDYDITNVNVNPRPGGGENTPEDMTITGILRVPGFHANKCFSKKGTSMNAIHKVATDLKLGFSSNEVDTNDEQIWICPFEKVSSFIFNVSNASWKDTDSFFSYFIDHYYHLNFINMGPLFADGSEIEESLARELLFHDYGKDSENAEFKGKVILTNWREMSATNFYIQSYALRNNAAYINNAHGYRRYAMFYDALIKEYVNIFSDPLTTEGAEREKIILKGRPGEDLYKQQIEKKWLGVQYGENGENCHEKYNIARITNFQNNVHLNKMSLIVHLENINFNLRRMQVIPVLIVVEKDFTRKKINEPIDESTNIKVADIEEIPITIDKTFSGYYVIQDIIYKYIKGEFKQECVLIRREWPVPPDK